MQPLVVVMGVAGSGKSTLGAALALRLRTPFCEGDALHPASNVDKMRAGRPLDDADRAPWLARVNGWLRRCADGGVVSCSALKSAYRDRLREGLDDRLSFVLLDPPRTELVRRLAGRAGHFMPASLLDSQLEALERPAPGEPRTLRLIGDAPVAAAADAVVAWLRTGSAGGGVKA